MNKNRLFRNVNQKMIGGVAAGLADYLGIDVSIMRILFVLAFFFPIPFSAVLFYVILWVIVPQSTSATTWVNQPRN